MLRTAQPRSTTHASRSKSPSAAPARSTQPCAASITQPSLEAATACASCRERSAFFTSSTCHESPSASKLVRIKLASLPLLDTGLSKYQVTARGRAAASVALNTAEGMGNTAGHKRQRYQTALGSAREVMACVDVAKAMRYVTEVDAATVDHLDHVIATLVRLVRPRA